jgi:hypothetical protein
MNNKKGDVYLWDDYHYLHIDIYREANAPISNMGNELLIGNVDSTGKFTQYGPLDEFQIFVDFIDFSSINLNSTGIMAYAWLIDDIHILFAKYRELKSKMPDSDAHQIVEALKAAKL